jgi:CBS domain-containing protein
MLTLRAAQQVSRDEWDATSVRDVLNRQDAFPVLSPRDRVLRALRTLAECGQSRLAVVENDSLVGILSVRDIMDYVEIRAGLGCEEKLTEPEVSNEPDELSSTIRALTVADRFTAGGHGVKTASRILGTAAFLEGWQVQDFPVTGANAALPSPPRESIAPILERGVITQPDYLIIADETLLSDPSSGVRLGIETPQPSSSILHAAPRPQGDTRCPERSSRWI